MPSRSSAPRFPRSQCSLSTRTRSRSHSKRTSRPTSSGTSRARKIFCSLVPRVWSGSRSCTRRRNRRRTRSIMDMYDDVAMAGRHQQNHPVASAAGLLRRCLERRVPRHGALLLAGPDAGESGRALSVVAACSSSIRSPRSFSFRRAMRRCCASTWRCGWRPSSPATSRNCRWCKSSRPMRRRGSPASTSVRERSDLR
jgi:hypothetical protein